MPKFSESCLDAVRSVPIALVAEKYTSLKKQGADFVGLSPFTSEKTPSFRVYSQSNRFNCFSSKKTGGTIDLVMEAEGLSMVEAVEVIAARHSVPLEYVGGNDRVRSVRTELFTIHEIAATFFREMFLKEASVQSYWTTDRGFALSSAEEFRVGFAPSDDGHELARRIFAQKVSFEAIRQCGLFFGRSFNKPESLVPRFSGRLMIPVHDAQGRVCAFAGRQIPGIVDRTEAGKHAKYINSPETPIFVKGRVVFNLHRARLALRDVDEAERFIIVEGQLDVIRLWETGHKLVVGIQGSATSKEHLEQIGRYPNGCRCLMDGDEAGNNAALRLIPLVIESETDMVFTPMPIGHDPDSVFKGISHDEVQARFRAIVGQSFSPLAMAARYLLPKPAERSALTPEGKARIVKRLLALLARTPSPAAGWFGTLEIAQLLRIDHLAVWHEFTRLKKFDPLPPPPATSASTT